MPAVLNKKRNRRNSGTRRPRQGKDPVGAYASDAWSLAKRTASGLNAIRKLINIETKIIDRNDTSTAFDRTGVVYPLTQIAQGTDYTNRVGDSVKLQHIEYHGRLFFNPAATQTLMRVIIFRDLDGYGTAPTTADLLEIVGTSPVCLSPYKWLNKQRFVILFDELVGASVNSDTAIPLNFSCSHFGHVHYLGSAAATASNGKGSLYVTYVSDEATNTPNFAHYCRVQFTDD